MLLYLWIDHEVCDDTVLFQIRVSALSVSRLHFIGPLQMFQRHRRDVNSAEEEQQDVREHFNNNKKYDILSCSPHRVDGKYIIWTRQRGNKRAGPAFIVFLLKENSSSGMSTFHKALHRVFGWTWRALVRFHFCWSQMKKTYAQREGTHNKKSSPRYSSSLHVIGQSHVMWPHIVLPFLESNYAAEHVARMHSDTHVNVNVCGISHLPVTTRRISAP